jgi:hypothetical protein
MSILIEPGKWRNLKNGKTYIVRGTVVNATNANEGQLMVLYHDSAALPAYVAAGPGTFVRDASEFLVKFEKEQNGSV